MSDTDQILLDEAGNWQTLEEQLPVELPGHGTISFLKFSCPKCHHEIESSKVKAKIVIFPETVATCQGVSTCTQCNAPMQSKFRIRAVGHSFQIETMEENGLHIWKSDFSIKNWFSNLWNQLKALKH